MHFDPQAETQSNTTPLFLAGGALLFIAILLLVSGGQSANDTETEILPTSDGGGGGGSVSMIPGAPVPVGAGGSPIPGAPPVTIIQDVRETLHRLPLDRNNPEKYDPPPRPRPKPR